MKILIPWILVIALGLGAYFLYADNQKRAVEISRLTVENNEWATITKENESLKKSAVTTDEVAQLRKDHEDVLRLRNEVQLLRRQTNELNSRLTTAQSASAQAQQTQQELSKMTAENAALKTQVPDPGGTAASDMELQVRQICIDHLRILDGAKQQWALENRKLATDTPNEADLLPYLPNQKMLACPRRGTYTLGNMQTTPTCSIPGHVLQ